jgi:CheY-like chemotaxis protein
MAMPASLEDVQELRGAGRRAAELTRQLLAFARKQVIDPISLDLNSVVRGSEKLLGRLLREDVELTLELAPHLWAVRCDLGQVEQVIMNLSVNARDAMPGGGRLTIATSNVHAEEAHVAGHPGEWVRLSIRDTGSGIPPEAKDHLFEPFFTTKEQGRGTGLGLATVYGIVTQNQGRIDVDSTVGQGSVFNVWLPRWLGLPENAALTPAPVPSGGHEPLLVVEDEPQVRAITVRALRSAGYKVLECSSGAEALHLDRRELDAVRLLITDVVMPGMNGRSLAAELIRRFPALRVLFVSGYSDEAIATRGVVEGGVGLLQKPFTPSELLGRVRAALDGAAAPRHYACG